MNNKDDDMSNTFIAEVGQKSAIVDNDVESLDERNSITEIKKPEFPEVKIDPPDDKEVILEGNNGENNIPNSDIPTPIENSNLNNDIKTKIEEPIPGYDDESNFYEEKPKKRNPIITILLMILCLALGAGGTYYYFEVYNVKENTETAEKKEKTEAIEENKATLIEFDASKCINDKTTNYTLADYDNSTGLSMKLGSDKKTVTLNINWNIYGQLIKASAYSSEVKSYEVNNFSQEVEDIYIGGVGQAAGGETALYLMKDGTVEYTPIAKANTSNNFSSFGMLKDVNDIVKFYTADASVPNSSGYVTILAQKADGTFYDLSKILTETGNY